MIIDIVFNVVDKGVGDLSGERGRTIVNETLNAVTDTPSHRRDTDRLRDFVIHLLIDAIDIMKDQVRRKKWKERLQIQPQLG